MHTKTRRHKHIGGVLIICVHTLNTKTIHSNPNSLNTFTKETGSPYVKLVFNKVKLSKVGSNAIVPVPHRDRDQKTFSFHLP